jgi:MFS family permease
MSAAPVPKHRRHTDEVVLALESRGLLDPARHEEAAGVVDQVEGGHARPTASLRRVLAEVAGYVGAAFVVAAVGAFFAPRWDDLARGVRLGLLVGAAVLLATAGVALGVTGGGLASLRTTSRALHRRLASVLFTGAAVAGAAAMIVFLLDWVGEDEATQGSYIGMGGALTLLVLSAVGYAIAPTLLGQGAIAIGAGYAVPFTWESLSSPNGLRIGLTYLAIGMVWLALAELRVWRELLPAQLIGSAFLLGGAQVLVVDYRWLSYTLTLLVGVAGFVLYVYRHAWPYLALGVIAFTLAVPEALLDLTEGSLGTALALLGAGVTLLVASLVGLQLRRDQPPPAHR